ncbi:MAG: hypothetical protein ABIQ60_00025 [Burkholderiaceae bacterium]
MNQNQSQNQKQRDGADQREALEKSEKDASREQPENFKDEETEDKVVEVLPIEESNSGAIRGLDPEK